MRQILRNAMRVMTTSRLKVRKRLAVITAAFPPIRAGESDHALQICERLSQAGINVHVITTVGCHTPADAGFQTHPVMLDWSWRETPRLCRTICRVDPVSILLIFSGFLYNDEPMITFSPFIVKKFIRNIHFVTQMEIIYPPQFSTFGKRLTRRAAQIVAGSEGLNYGYGALLRDSDGIISLCPAHHEFFLSVHPAIGAKATIVPPPPLLRMAPVKDGQTRLIGRQKLGVGSDEFLLAFFGYADHNKGIDTLFNALAILRRRGAKVRLAMIGGGRGIAVANKVQTVAKVLEYENSLIGLPAKLGIEEAVLWLDGYASDSLAASELLWSADACVLPFRDGVTMSRSSLAAAMAHRLPVVTTRVEKVEEPLVDQDNVLLVPAQDDAALAETISRLIADKDLCRRLSAGAARLSAEWFSWDAAVEKTIARLGLA